MFIAICLFAFPVLAAEQIQDFSVQATLSYDRVLSITETIRYSFDDAERHGIYRMIPEVYARNGARYKLNLKISDVKMDGYAIPWAVTHEGNDLKLKIGDPEKTMTGSHVFLFTYTTAKAINDFADSRELYWNVNGNGWDVPSLKTLFTLSGPAAPDKVVCYAGYFGSTESECVIKQAGSTVTISASRALGPSEGLTFVIAYPLSALRELTTEEKLKQFFLDNVWAILPLLTAFVMLLVWRKWGKEPVGRGTVVAQYEEPRKLPPALMAGLMEQTLSGRAVSATILDLARRGYLKIRFEGEPQKKGWFAKSPKITFVKVKEPDAELAVFEQDVWKSIFKSGETEVKPEDLVGKAYREIGNAKHSAEKELRDRKFFGMTPSIVRALWIGAAVGMFTQGIVLVGVFGGLYIVASILSAIVMIIIGWQMPQMTKEGAIVKEECEGFKLFLSVTEKARLAFTDAPERRPDQFARFLPAAVAFGVEEKWAGQFAGLEIKPPSYMEGNFAAWNALSFAHSMSTIHSASSASMYSAPSSAGHGGSGFSGGGSGGGFGGGGGGSW